MNLRNVCKDLLFSIFVEDTKFTILMHINFCNISRYMSSYKMTWRNNIKRNIHGAQPVEVEEGGGG